MSAMRLGSAVLSFAVFWYLARTSGASFVGAYAFLLGVYAFLQQLPLLGLHLAAVRDVAANADDAPKVVANLGSLGVVTAVMLGLACYFVGIGFYPPEMHLSFALLGGSMLPTAWVNLAECILIGRQNMRIVALVNLGEAALRSLVSAVAVFNGGGLGILFLIFLVGRIGAAIAYQRSPPVPRWQRHLVDWPRLRAHLCETPVFLGIMVFSAALSRLDLFFLSKLGSFADVGIYAVAAKIYDAALMAPAVITSVLYPAFSQAANRELAELAGLSRTATFWVFVLALPCAIAVALVAQPMINLIFGASYEKSAEVLQILMGGVVLMALNQLLTLVLLARHRQNLDFQTLLISTVCNALLLGALIPPLGVTGAAWAVLAAMLVQLCVRYGLVRHFEFEPGFGTLWRPVLAAVAMVMVALEALHLHPAIMLLLALATYFITLFAVGGIRAEAVRAVVGLVRGRPNAPIP